MNASRSDRPASAPPRSSGPPSGGPREARGRPVTPASPAPASPVPAAPSSTGRSALAFFAALAGLVLLVGSFPWSLQAELVHDRSAVGAGEVWRLLTASLVHVRWEHLLWNLAALAGLAVVLGRRFGGAAWTGVAVASALGAGGGLYLLSPATPAMAGLSAVLHGLAAAGGLAEAVRGRRGLGATVLGLLAAKLAWEQVAGPLPGVVAAVGGAVAVDAHLYGASAGLAAGALALTLALIVRRRTAADSRA